MANPISYSERRQFLEAVAAFLHRAMESLVGETLDPKVYYVLRRCEYVTKLMSGYLKLTPEYRTQARVFIRPMIENMIKGVACMINEENVLRIVHEEIINDIRLLNNNSEIFKKSNEFDSTEIARLVAKIDNEVAVAKASYVAFQGAFQKKFPSRTYSDKPINVEGLAAAASASDWYAPYRLYSQVIHGSMRYFHGELDDHFTFDDYHVASVGLVLLSMIAKSTSAKVPDTVGMAQRFQELFVQ